MFFLVHTSGISAPASMTMGSNGGTGRMGVGGIQAGEDRLVKRWFLIGSKIFR